MQRAPAGHEMALISCPILPNPAQIALIELCARQVPAVGFAVYTWMYALFLFCVTHFACTISNDFRCAHQPIRVLCEALSVCGTCACRASVCAKAGEVTHKYNLITNSSHRLRRARAAPLAAAGLAEQSEVVDGPGGRDLAMMTSP